MTRIDIVRRATALAALALGAALALTACGSSPATPVDERAGESTGGAGASSTEGFPLTIDTAYGEITLKERPEKIVALSAQYADVLAAIGVEPVATSAGVPDIAMFEEAYPWLADQEIGEFAPDLVSAEYKPVLEAIAKYEPDLILTSTYQVDEDLFTQISAIAPTYAGATVGNVDWNVLLEDVGQLTGETAAAESAAAEVESVYAQAREALPGLEGRTYQFVAHDGTKFWFGNGSWLEGFGLTPADNQDNTQSGGTATEISLENVAQLDADALGIWFWQTEQATLEADPRYQKLPAVQNDAVLVSTMPIANATNSAGPLSIAWAIDWAVERFQASKIAE